jgi:hypothetical protein
MGKLPFLFENVTAAQVKYDENLARQEELACRGELLRQLGFARACWTDVGEIYRLRQTR